MIVSKEVKFAEFLGAMAGDGNLSLYKSDYRVSIVGHKDEDLDNLEYLGKLFFGIFGKKAVLKNKKRYLLLEISNKEIFYQINEAGIPIGKKSDTIQFPSWIFENKNLSIAFLRGLADTEFSVTFKKAGRKSYSYPRISVDISSKEIIYQVSSVLKELEISHKIYERNRERSQVKYRTYMIDINGRENLSKWMKNVGFHNKKHLAKIEIWEKEGYYNPGTISSRLVHLV